jgi:L,D-transpeptidase YcbB
LLSKPFWFTLTFVCAAQLAGPPAVSQSAPASLPVVEADIAPAPESGAPDPLAPTRVEGPAPLAPGAPVAVAQPAPGAATDPIVLLVRQQHVSAPDRGAERRGHDRRGPDRADDVAAIATFYGEITAPVWTSAAGFNAKARQALEEIAKADDWGLKAAAFDLPVLTEAQSGAQPTPQALADAEVKLSLAVLKYARFARGGRLEPSAVSARFDQKPAIYEPTSVLQAAAVADKADAFLRSLHPTHPQFERLRQALLVVRAASAAGEPLAKGMPSVQQIVVNMERWRWMPTDLGAFHVWDSIPDQMTRVYDEGREVLAEKIVVGKLGSPTPVFSADMQFVIFHPSWGVPAGMKSYELAPQLRDTGGGWFSSKPLASSVLKAHGLQVTSRGAPVDPDKIEWANVNIQNFEFTQNAGPTNVLGVVKFRFPNKHDVYMHDTPERHLFGGAVRAFSHGCMRVQNPIHLAEVLLAHDKGWTVEKVHEHARRGGEVALSTPIPVHVTYFTVTVDEQGAVYAYPDIYGLDSRVASALEGREVQIVTGSVGPRRSVAGAAGGVSLANSNAAAGDEPPAKPTQSGRAAKAKPRQKTVVADKPFNPFSGLFGQ